MAVFEKEIFDGVQLANGLDYCYKCHKPGSVIPSDHSIEYQEVFKMNVNGLSYCICLDHLQEMLGDYVLVHKDTLTDDEVLELPKELIENGTHEEVIAYIEKAIKK